MSDKDKRLIRYFDKFSDDHLGDIYLPDNVSLDDLKPMFDTSVDPQMYDCYPLNSEHLPYFERLTNKKLDFDKYEYFLECE